MRISSTPFKRILIRAGLTSLIASFTLVQPTCPIPLWIRADRRRSPKRSFSPADVSGEWKRFLMP